MSAMEERLFEKSVFEGIVSHAKSLGRILHLHFENLDKSSSIGNQLAGKTMMQMGLWNSTGHTLRWKKFIWGLLSNRSIFQSMTESTKRADADSEPCKLSECIKMQSKLRQKTKPWITGVLDRVHVANVWGSRHFILINMTDQESDIMPGGKCKFEQGFGQLLALLRAELHANLRREPIPIPKLNRSWKKCHH